MTTSRDIAFDDARRHMRAGAPLSTALAARATPVRVLYATRVVSIDHLPPSTHGSSRPLTIDFAIFSFT